MGNNCFRQIAVAISGKADNVAKKNANPLVVTRPDDACLFELAHRRCRDNRVKQLVRAFLLGEDLRTVGFFLIAQLLILKRG